MMKRIEKLFIFEIDGDITIPSEALVRGYIGCWREAGHSYLFYSEPAKDVIEVLLAGNPDYRLVSETEMEYDQWEPADALRPFEVAPLSFVPAWVEDGNEDSMKIRLDPGVVFGAGTHHTTHKCLEFLVSLMEEKDIYRVVDLGTGTGILALAAARLGATDVIAIDNNNLAIETAEKNVLRNELQGRIRCILADAAEYLEIEADLTLANLILGELKKIFNLRVNFGSRWYIISGLNCTEVDTFKQLIEQLPFKIIREEMENLWYTLLLEKI
jgi:ribosomal protein L11 methyltransferase